MQSISGAWEGQQAQWLEQNQSFLLVHSSRSEPVCPSRSPLLHTRVLSVYITADPINRTLLIFLGRAFAYRLNSVPPTKSSS